VSTTAISQTWRNDPSKGQRRTWQVQLTVTGTGVTADEIAAIEPIAAAIEGFAAVLTHPTDTGHQTDA
jgi:hypothetical protein